MAVRSLNIKDDSDTGRIKIITPILITLLSTALVSFFIPIIGVLGLLALLLLMSGWLKKFTFIESFFLSLLSVLSLNILLYSLVTLFHLHLPIEYASTVTFTLLASFILIKHKTHVQAPTWVKRTKSDASAIAVAALTFFLLLIPIFQKDASYIAQFLSYGEDNASHYALSRYITEHGSFTYNEDADAAGVVYSLEIYPQGFHVNAAAAVSLLKPFDISETRFLKVYVVFITMMYALFVFWLIKLCTFAAEKISWKIVLASLPGLALLAALSFFILMLDRGFQPQIFSFAYLCAVVYTLLILDRDRKLVKQTVLLVALLSVGIAASWWFLLSIVFLLLLFYIISNSYVKLLFQGIHRYAAILGLITFGVLYPIFVNILLSKKHDPLSEQGGVDKLALELFVYVAVAALTLPLFVRLKHRSIQYIYLALVGSTILAALIGGYHLARLGHLEYYFYKTTYAIFLFLIVIASIGIMHLANKLFLKMSNIYRWLIPSLLIGVVIVFSITSNLVFIKVYVNNWFPNSVEIADTPILFTEKTDSYTDILFVGDCSGASDYLSNRWAGARLLSESSERSKIMISILNGRWSETNRRLRNYLSKQDRLLLSIDRRCADKLPVLRDIPQYSHVTAIYTH